MGKRKTHEEVRLKFYEEGLTLLSDTYTRSSDILQYKCNTCGNVGNLKYAYFLCGIGCSACGLKRRKAVRRFLYQEVVEMFNKKNYKLISAVYINTRQKLNIICPEGHEDAISLQDFRKGRGCKLCSNKRKSENSRYSYKYIKAKFNARAYTLTSKDYINCKSVLDFICPEGHSGKIKYSDFQAGCGCRICGIKYRVNPQKLSYIEVEKYFKEAGCVLLEETYINSKTNMKYKCSCGNIAYISLQQLKKGHRCRRCCGVREKYTYAEVVTIFNNEGYLLLERIYNYNKYPMQVICPNNHMIAITFDSFLQGHRCAKCYREQNIGKNNPAWNPDKTDEERQIRRRDGEYSRWRSNILMKDNYTCQITGKCGKLVAHHLEGYANNRELRYDINNGVTLLKSVHSAFHKQFGIKNNTKEQYEQFKNTITEEEKIALVN